MLTDGADTTSEGLRRRGRDDHRPITKRPTTNAADIAVVVVCFIDKSRKKTNKIPRPPSLMS